MGKFIINGGNRLSGDIEINGSKNSALAILFACIAVNGEITLRKVPDIADTRSCIEILRYYGISVKYADEATLIIDSRNAEFRPIPYYLTKRLRASSYLLGALLSRFGKCEIPESGGCDIGARPLDLHINALKALGATECANGIQCSEDGLAGCEISFPIKTVGGTVNTIISALKAKGKTVIYNAAREPHIVDLAKFLISCGADIRGMGTDTVSVYGTDALHGCEYTVDSDMIETGTFMIAALATKGAVRCTNAPCEQLTALCETLMNMGADITVKENSVAVRYLPLSPIKIVTNPYPGFPTDLQPQISALLGSITGSSSITENVFENRYGYTNELRKFGMNCNQVNNKLYINGAESYKCASVNATDLRGGAACVIAALSANGSSSVSNAEIIDRGYSDIDKRLSSLGADIRRA